MNNLEIFLEELNNVETLDQRLTIECENNSPSILYATLTGTDNFCR